MESTTADNQAPTESPAAPPQPPDPATRAALSDHCRATVAANDRVFAILLIANTVMLAWSFVIMLRGQYNISALLFVAWGLLIGAICLLLGGRYAGRASATRHMRAGLLRMAEAADGSEPEEIPRALKLETAERRFAATYSWLIACAELLFVAGIVCSAVYAALTINR